MARHTLLLEEDLPGQYKVRLFWDCRSMNCFVVKEYHPGSDWLHGYQCGSLRKAMKYIDETLRDRIHRELHPPREDGGSCECAECWQQAEGGR